MANQHTGGKWNVYDEQIKQILEDNKGYGSSGTLEYWGSYLGMMEDWADCLSIYSPDYPDSSDVDSNINEMFRDYI